MYQDLNQNQALSVNLKDQWNSVLKKLNTEYGNEIFNSWIKNISIRNLDEDVIYFTVPTRFINICFFRNLSYFAFCRFCIGHS